METPEPIWPRSGWATPAACSWRCERATRGRQPIACASRSVVRPGVGSCNCPALQLDELEVAALLHDVGKLGIPDHDLVEDRSADQRRSPGAGPAAAIAEQVLLSCCASQNVLNIVKYAAAWYDGSRPGFDRRDQQLPLGARIVSIIDAYDSMTTEQVYRRGMTRGAAHTAELLACAGTQFDPELVEMFCDLLSTRRFGLTADVSRRWLHELSSDTNPIMLLRPPGNRRSACPGDPRTSTRCSTRTCWTACIDGVVFVDRTSRSCCGTGRRNN